LAHNHPSGDPLPSSEDISITKRITEAGEWAGYEVVDHVITNGGKYASLREFGLHTGGASFKGAKAPKGMVVKEAPQFPPEKAPWEIVERGPSGLKRADGPDALRKTIKALRQDAPDAGHIIYLTTKLHVTGIERVPDVAKEGVAGLGRLIREGAAREGAASVILDLTPIAEQNRISTVKLLAKKADMLGVSVLDALAQKTDGSVESYRELGLVAEPKSEYGSAGGMVRETGPTAARYLMAAQGGTVGVYDTQTGRTISTGVEDTPQNRDAVEVMLRDFNNPAESSLRAADKAVADRPALDEPTHTPGVLRQIVGNSGCDLLEKGGGPLARLADKVYRYYDRWAELKGALGKPLRDAVAGLSRSEKKQVFAEFHDYIRQREMEGREAAQQLLEAASENTRKLVTAWENLTEFTSAENQRLGVMVREGDTWREIGSFGRDYWPRMVRPDIDKILRQGKGAEHDKLVQDAAAHWNVTKERAAAKLGEARGNLVTADDFFANLEMARSAELPADWYDFRFEVVADRFVNMWSKRIAQIEAFGQVTGPQWSGRVSWSGQAFKDAYDATRADPHAGDVVLKVHNDVYGLHAAESFGKITNALRSYTAWTKYITNLWATVRNSTQPFTTTLPEFGPRAFVKAYWDVLWHPKQEFGAARDAGVIADDLIQGFITAEEFSARASAALQRAGKLTGSALAEQSNRVVSAVAARVWLRDALRSLRDEPMGHKALLAKMKLRRLRINEKTLMAEGLAGREAAKFMRAAVTVALMSSPNGPYSYAAARPAPFMSTRAVTLPFPSYAAA
jgi:hypothetical protein